MATVQAMCSHKNEWHLINEQINASKINGVSLRETLMNESIKATTHVSVLKILCGIKVIIESELFGVTFSPQPASVREMTYKCKGGASFKKYLGMEVVNFKMRGMRGQFTHNASLIVDIASNFTDLGTLREVVAAIACYCRVNFEDTNASTSKELFETAYQTHRGETHLVLGMSQRDLNKISEVPAQWGILRVIKESEFLGRRPIEAILNTKMQIKDLKTGQTIGIETPEEKTLISPLVVIPPGPLDQWLDPRRRLVRVFQRVMSRKEELLFSITHNDWSWMNSSISEVNQTDVARRVSSMAREYCAYMVSLGEENELFSLPLLAFCYCFSGIPGFTGRALDYECKMEWYPGIIISIDATEGAFTFNKDKGRYYLFGDPIKGRRGAGVEWNIYQGLLPQFEMLPHRKGSNYAVATLKSLMENPGSVEEGEIRKIFIANQPMLVRKNRRIAIQTLSTIDRQIGKRIQSKLSSVVLKADSTRKRKAESDSASNGSSSGCGASCKFLRPLDD